MIIGCSVDVEEALSRSWRFEPLHLSLPPSYWLVRVFCSVVGAFVVDMFSRKAQLLKRCMI